MRTPQEAALRLLGVNLFNKELAQADFLRRLEED